MGEIEWIYNTLCKVNVKNVTPPTVLNLEFSGFQDRQRQWVRRGPWWPNFEFRIRIPDNSNQIFQLWAPTKIFYGVKKKNKIKHRVEKFPKCPFPDFVLGVVTADFEKLGVKKKSAFFLAFLGPLGERPWRASWGEICCFYYLLLQKKCARIFLT